MDSTEAPLIKHRLISIIYEAMLMFGVAFIVTLIVSLLLQRHPATLQMILPPSLIVIIGTYFVWVWSHGGQTLAMKTWHIKLVSQNNQVVNTYQASARYFLNWLCFLPGLVLAWVFHAKTSLLIIIPCINIVVWALTMYLDPQRQSLQDRLAGTKLISTRSAI